MLRPRYSPSGPFIPFDGLNDGFVSRVFYTRGPDVNTNVSEGGSPPGDTIIDIPIVITAADHIDQLRWIIEGDIEYTIQQPQTEDPELFTVSVVLGIQGAAAGAPTAVLVLRGDGEPNFQNDVNADPYNRASFRYVVTAATFAGLAVGTNHFTLGLVFFGTPGLHTAIVPQNYSSLVVTEIRGGGVIIG